MAGEAKRHPDWPTQKAIAIHTPQFTDDPDTHCASWQAVYATGSGGSRYMTAAQVADWPDVDGDWPTAEEPSDG